MATKTQVSLANRMLLRIKEAGRINKFDLMDVEGIGIASYNQIAGWFKHRFEDTLHQVEYDKKTKDWIWKEVQTIERIS